MLEGNMDIFGHKSRELLGAVQEAMMELQGQMQKDIESIKDNQVNTDSRVDKLEESNVHLANQITQLQKSVEEMRDSAIRGEIASGRKTKDVAIKFEMSPARISQIAPRRKYSNG